MSVDDVVKRELAKLKVNPAKIAEAEQNVSDMRGFGFDVNLLTVLLADKVIDKKQVNCIMEKAQMDEGKKTSVIEQINTVKKAMSVLPGAKETLIMTNRNVDNSEMPDIYDDVTIREETEKSIGKTAAKKTVPSSPQKAPSKKTAKSRYTEFKLIGEGGMGCVYKVYDNLMGRYVAMKTIRPEVKGDMLIASLSKFKNEVQTTAKLEDERIVRAYDVGKGTGGTFMTMEFVQGESLEDILDKIYFDKTEYKKEIEEKEKRIKDYLQLISANKDYKDNIKKYKKQLEKIEQEKTPEAIQKHLQEREEYHAKYPIRELMRLFEEACRAVAFTNRKGYIHRDIKPANIMIKTAEGNKAKLMDFGVAINIDEPTPEYIAGTPHFMGPEQAGGEKQSPLFDVYSLGATLYKILTNRTPFDAEDVNKVLLKIVDKKEATHAAKVRHGLKDKPPELCEIAMKAINKDATQRYQTADELADDIKNWLEYKPTTVYTENFKEWRVRTLKRNPWIKYTAMAMAGIAALSITIGTPILYISESKASRRAEQAQIEKEKADNAEKGKTKAEQDKQKAQEEERKAREEKERAEREQREKEAKRRLAMDEYQKGVDFVRKYNDLETAVKHFDKALEIYPNLADAYYEKGLIEYSNLYYEEAIKEFINADKASQNDTQKTHKQAVFYTGLVYLDLFDDVPKSTEYFKKVIQKTEEDDYFALLSRSLVSYIEKNYDDAIKLADLATQKYKNAWEGWYISAAYRMQGASNNFTDIGLEPYRELETALKDLNKALTLNPKQVRCLTMRAQLYCAMKEPEKGNQDAKQLLQEHPNIPALLIVLAITEYSMKQNQKSLETLMLAEQQGADTAINHHYQALNYLLLEEYANAEKQFTKSIEQKPNAKKYAYRGYARFEQGKIEEAIDDEKKALELEREPQAYLVMGLCYKEKKDYDKAIQNLQEACNLRLAPAYRELGMLYAEQNNKKALPYLKAYLDTNDPYEREKVIEIIRELEK